MNITTIQAIEARHNLGELLERVYYQNKVFRIARKDKPMGWLVGEGYINAIGKVVDYIIENEPILADTLAIMLDDDIRSVIEQGRKEWAAGEKIPIEEALK